MGKPLIHVACGVLQRASGEVLLAQRPDGKIAAGWWEFPGGKIEDGEAPRAALLRELEEELGVHIEDARPLIRYRHDYSNRTVMLDSWLVTGYSGELHGREGQALAWVAPEHLHAWPQSLPTVAPSARALLLPNQYVFTPQTASVERIAHGLARLPPGCLLRLRLPALDEAAYREAARRLLPPARAQGLRVVLDRDPADAEALGADGWHASEAAALRLGARVERGPALQLASCHDADSLRRVAAAGFDAAVLGTVCATASHPGRVPLGWDAFGAAAQYVGIPVYAIGGVGPADLAQAFAAYGQGVAGISAYW
ncbi:MAG: Nudix family hydrolase [Gammaproteobacteria bacterium]